MANTADSNKKGTEGTKESSIPAWSQEANADIESAAKEEVLNYESVNFKKLSPRIAKTLVFALLAFAITFYIFFLRH